MNSLRITRIGPYEIVSSIGAGGTGEVFRARDAAQPRRGDQAEDQPEALVEGTLGLS